MGQTNSENKINGASRVACGKDFTLVVVDNNNGSQDLVMWKNSGFVGSNFVFCGQSFDFN